jgi:Icc-related predicted phosphoesterase
VTRRIDVLWPDARPFADRGERPIRLLAVSDAPDPALEQPVNRAAIAPVDGIVGCGDLEPTWLSFLGDAFRAPIVYVRGNHDHGGAWTHGAAKAPLPLASGHTDRIAGIAIGGLAWPGVDEAGNRRRPWRAWRDALGLARRVAVAHMTRPQESILVISHAPPEGVGDVASDPYHRGFAAYRWLLDRLRPPLWLHGHTTIAQAQELTAEAGPTSVVNVTGSVLVELHPPSAGRPVP